MRRCPAPRSLTMRKALAVVAVLMTTVTATAREKADVVTLINGDRLTGEIKQLDLGVLTLKTDHMGTISIEWIAVATVESDQLFEVNEEDGEWFFGTLRPGEGEHELEVVGLAGQEYVLQHRAVVRISQMEQGWWQRWRGYIDLGLTLASANRQRDLSIDAEATYSGERFRLQNTFSASGSDREDAARTSRADVVSNFRWDLKKRWFWYSEVHFSRNEETNLDLRSSVSGGAGRYVVQSHRSQWSLYGGVSGLREDFSGEEPGGWSSEAVLASDYQLYLFEGRETTLDASLAVLPSLTVANRYRVEFSSSFRRKLIRDFTVALSLDTSYDSRPAEGAPSSDTRFRTTVGWSF